MDSKELEKVDLVVNQPVRSDIGVIEDDVMPEVPKKLPSEDEGKQMMPVPYMSTHSKLSRGMGAFVTLAAIMSAMKGRVMGGFRPSQKIRKTNETPSGSRRKRIHAKKRMRKMEELARRNNRGVKGRTQLHRHR